jgi:glycosyltransferase
MEKINLYIFISNGEGLKYGVGTYIYQLVEWIKNEKIIDLTLLLLFCEDEKELKIEQNEKYKLIKIPQNYSNKIYTEINLNRYFRNCIFLLKTIIPDDKNNVFHINFITAANSLTFWLKELFQGKVLLTVHFTEWSFDLMGDKKQLRQILDKSDKQLTKNIEKTVLKEIKRDIKTMQQCDKIIFTAKHSIDSAKEIYGVEENQICLIPHGLQDEFQPLSMMSKVLLKKRYYISTNEKIILFAGRLGEAKGINYLLQTFGKVLKKHPDIHLIIVGDGNIDQWISTINNFWKKVTFTGRLNKKQLFDLYRIADIGVVCSLHEEFGLVALEMMMHGLPMIVTDVGGLSELVENEHIALKVPIKNTNNKRGIDTAVLKKQICYLLENQSIALQLGQNARKIFLQKYESTHFKKKMLNLYTELITK